MELNRICAIIGAGYSFVAGLPLARDLLDAQPMVMSKGMKRRFHAVTEDYKAWKNRNLDIHVESYLSELRTNFFSRPAPRFEWVQELVANVLATTKCAGSEHRYSNFITRASGCIPHHEFWRLLITYFRNVAVVTTNYDLLVERSLRHRPFNCYEPGCFYDGIPANQILIGKKRENRFLTKRGIEWQAGSRLMHGRVAICKIHGSLNWGFGSADRIELYQDHRAVFRRDHQAAFIAPMTEKEVEPWLGPVWDAAHSRLSRADVWVLCGYSAPEYDLAVLNLLRYSRQNLKCLIALDPNSSAICTRLASQLSCSRSFPLEGLPKGNVALQKLLRDRLRLQPIPDFIWRTRNA